MKSIRLTIDLGIAAAVQKRRSMQLSMNLSTCIIVLSSTSVTVWCRKSSTHNFLWDSSHSHITFFRGESISFLCALHKYSLENQLREAPSNQSTWFELQLNNTSSVRVNLWTRPGIIVLIDASQVAGRWKLRG